MFNRNGQELPLPWDLCAKTVGNRVTFKAWPETEPEPAYGDPTHGATVALPPGWVYPGNNGWYIGHLLPGDTARFAGLHVRP